MKAAFEFLLKFKPVVFEQGRLDFQNTGPAFLAVALLSILGFVLLHSYLARRRVARLPGSPTPGRLRTILFALRLGVLLVILLMLAAPSILISEINPRENRLAVLVDGSLSMQIQDNAAKSRAAQAQELLRPDGPFVRRAGEKFQVDYYSFSDP